MTRVTRLNDKGVNDGGRYVLYWMIAARRTRDNFALDHAATAARELGVPLLLFEPLRIGYEWACDRFHLFVMQGMRDNAQHADEAGVTYYPYVEPEDGADKGLLAALASDAALVVTDDYPCFFLPRMTQAAAAALDVRVEAIDGNGILPMRATEKVYTRAFSFRRYVHEQFLSEMPPVPQSNALADGALHGATVSDNVIAKWPSARPHLDAPGEFIAGLDIDHAVGPSSIIGGAAAATERLDVFLAEGLPHYAERNHPDKSVASGLSPYLHFGHISAQRIFQAVIDADEWHPGKINADRKGKREEFWGASAGVEGFLDELITWREIGFNRCALTDNFDRYESLPGWAQTTLGEHADDEERTPYSLQTLEAAQTDDEIWNAAQRQLVADGIIHNYLRMLWGKKLLEWTESPQQALDWMIHLNNKYALDGRDPNSYSGIFWVLGRYDRAWGPERPIFGKIRYMTSASTKRKLKLKEYLTKWGQTPSLF